jgi:hypothetical protein
MGTYAGVDYNPAVCHSRVDYNTFTMGNPMPESTLTLSQNHRYPPVRVLDLASAPLWNGKYKDDATYTALWYSLLSEYLYVLFSGCTVLKDVHTRLYKAEYSDNIPTTELRSSSLILRIVGSRVETWAGILEQSIMARNRVGSELDPGGPVRQPYSYSVPSPHNCYKIPALSDPYSIFDCGKLNAPYFGLYLLNPLLL